MNGEGAEVGRFSTTSSQPPSSFEPSVEPIIPLRLAVTILPRLAISSPDFSSAGSMITRMRRLSTTSFMSICP